MNGMSGMGGMGGMSMGGSSGGMEMNMSMYFTTGTTISLWLRKWTVNASTDPGAYAAAFIGVILIGVLNEAVITFRTKLHQAYFPCGTEHSCADGSANSSSDCCGTSLGEIKVLPKRNNPCKKRKVPTPVDAFAHATKPVGRLVVSLLYLFSATLGYLLMLAAMTFDVGIFFAVVLGVGLGHFVFFRKPTREMANLLLSSSDGCGCAMA